MSLSGCADVSDPYGTVVTVWPIYLHSLSPTHTHTHTHMLIKFKIPKLMSSLLNELI